MQRLSFATLRFKNGITSKLYDFRKLLVDVEGPKINLFHVSYTVHRMRFKPSLEISLASAVCGRGRHCCVIVLVMPLQYLDIIVKKHQRIRSVGDNR